MKRVNWVVIFLVLTGIQSIAQKSVENLQAPSSPAASVIGIQPTTVLKPKTLEALETSVFSNYFNGQGQVLIPNNLALEFMPYWTKDRPLSVEEYLYPGIGKSMYQNLSLSVASTQNFVINDTVSSNALGFGLRTTVYFGGDNLKTDLKNKLAPLQDRVKLVSAVFLAASSILIKEDVKNIDNFLDKLINEIKVKNIFKNLSAEEYPSEANLTSSLRDYFRKNLPILPATPLNASKASDQEYLAILNVHIDKFFKIREVYDKVIEELVTKRPGWKLDLAFASFLNFPTNDFDFSVSPKQSIWITPSYRLKDKLSFLEILGVIRYNWYDLNYYKEYFKSKETYENNLDYGLNVNFIFDKFTLQLEAVGRTSSTLLTKTTDSTGITTTTTKKDHDFQCIGTFSYRLNKNLCLSYSFGKQFQPMLNYKGTLISSLSLNMGFGGQKKENLTVEAK